MAKKWTKRNLLLVFTMIGVLLGISLGFILRRYDVSDQTLTLVSFPGILFMRALYLVIGPLILTSVISGISGVKSGNLGKAGSQIILYYLTTTAFASVLGKYRSLYLFNLSTLTVVLKIPVYSFRHSSWNSSKTWRQRWRQRWNLAKYIERRLYRELLGNIRCNTRFNQVTSGVIL